MKSSIRQGISFVQSALIFLLICLHTYVKNTSICRFYCKINWSRKRPFGQLSNGERKLCRKQCVTCIARKRKLDSLETTCYFFFTLGFSHISLNKNLLVSKTAIRTIVKWRTYTLSKTMCYLHRSKTKVGLFGDNLLF